MPFPDQCDCLLRTLIDTAVAHRTLSGSCDSGRGQSQIVHGTYCGASAAFYARLRVDGQFVGIVFHLAGEPESLPEQTGQMSK